jgi:hypothetical protein
VANDEQRNGAQRRRHPHRGRHLADLALAYSLASGKTIAASAERAGISRRLAFLRLKQPEFQDLLVKVRTQIFHRGRGALAAGLSQAVRRLRALANSDNEQVAVKAAGLLLKATAPGQLVTALALDTLGEAKLLEMAEADEQADEDFANDEDDDEAEPSSAPPAPAPAPAAAPPAAAGAPPRASAGPLTPEPPAPAAAGPAPDSTPGPSPADVAPPTPEPPPIRPVTGVEDVGLDHPVPAPLPAPSVTGLKVVAAPPGPKPPPASPPAPPPPPPAAAPRRTLTPAEAWDKLVRENLNRGR